LVILPKPLLNHAKNFSSRFLFASSSLDGLSIIEHNAGVKDKATKAEMITDVAIVIANC
jgi:hypothetical protein